MNFNLTFEQSNTEFSFEFGEVTEGREYELYPGPYTATPKVTEQTLLTASKMCSRNIEVEAVPYLEVSNVSGGKTATIAYIT